MKGLVIKTNPASDETTQEREENFREFCQQVADLADACGYSDFVISVRNSETPASYSTAIATDTARIAFELRDNAFALAKEFVGNMITDENFVLKRWARS